MSCVYVLFMFVSIGNKKCMKYESKKGIFYISEIDRHGMDAIWRLVLPFFLIYRSKFVNVVLNLVKCDCA